MPEISRVLEWDAGHRIVRHESKCRNLHGHRYKAIVTVRAAQLDSLGRVIDFGVIKTIVGGWIDDHWDHNVILNPCDSLAEILFDWADTDLSRRHPYLMAVDRANPTAENLAAELAFEVGPLLLEKGVELVHIELWETPNSCADWSKDENARTESTEGGAAQPG